MTKLTPEQQALAFLLAKQQGTQPTSGGLSPEVPDQAAQMGVGQVDAEAQQQLFGQQMPPPGSFKDDPQGAVTYITEVMKSKTGPQLERDKKGNLVMPSSNPFFRFLGAKTKVDSPNFYDTAKAAGIEKFMPSELAKTPEGTTFLGKQGFEAALKASQTDNVERPNKELGEAIKVKAADVFGMGSQRYNSVAKAIDSMGGLPLSKLGEFGSQLTTTTKTLDIFKGEDGRTYAHDRANGETKPILGNVGGVLSSFNPLELGIVKTEMAGFAGDPVIKEARKQIGQLTSISALIESRNPASIGILASNIAKGLGKEAGVLTEGDIARSTGSQQLGDRWKRFWSKHVKGQLSDTDVSDFNGLMLDINKAAQRQISNVADERAARLSRLLKRPAAELREVIAYGTDFMEADKATPLESSSPFTADRPKTATPGQTSKGTKFKIVNP